MIVNVLYGLYKKLAKDGYTRAYSFTIFFVDIRVIPVTWRFRITSVKAGESIFIWRALIVMFYANICYV